MSDSSTPKRCDWAGSDPDMVAYHDTEWGVPVHDDTRPTSSSWCWRGRRPG